MNRVSPIHSSRRMRSGAVARRPSLVTRTAAGPACPRSGSAAGRARSGRSAALPSHPCKRPSTPAPLPTRMRSASGAPHHHRGRTVTRKPRRRRPGAQGRRGRRRRRAPRSRRNAANAAFSR